MMDLSPLLKQSLAEYKAGRYEQAEALIREHLQAHPDDPMAVHQLAYAITARGQAARDVALQEEGYLVARRALDLAPGEPRFRETYLNFAAMLRKVSDMLALTEAWYRENPTDTRALWAHSAALQECCRFDEARQVYREGLALNPGDPPFLANFAAFSNYDDGMSARERFEVHLAVGQALAALGTPQARHSNKPDPERKLRLGFVSPDFRLHSCMYFFEPLLENLDPAQFDVYLYHTLSIVDDVTARLKARVKGFRMVGDGANDGLGFKVWNDRIDVLIDLAGHTTGNRLAVLQGGPAPLQGTYLGYPNTTGMSSVHFRLVDSITDPPGSEDLASEHLVRLDPCFLVFRPSADACEPEPPPSLAGSGPVVFASFNNAMKTSPTSLRLWARILKECPGSVLLLKAGSFGQEHFRAQTAARLEALGVSPDRFRLEGGTPNHRAHFQAYNRVDIALDPTPYNGTTTTCEALWMGVPVVALAGEGHGARVSASLLHAVGLPDLAAASHDDYVRVAVGLANDPARRAELRRGLRPRMAASPLCDAPGFAARFSAALRGLWRHWCASTRGVH